VVSRRGGFEWEPQIEKEDRGGRTKTMAQSQTHTTARFNGVKIFSATMAQERENLGEKVTAWIREHPQCQVVDTIVTQSSDEAFHCLAITLFYLEERAPAK
jgi:hypothetical protein